LTKIDQVQKTIKKVLKIRQGFAYCYQSVNAISLSLLQGDHTNQLPLYIDPNIYFSEIWEFLKPMPQDRSFQGCVPLPNSDDILLLGSWDSGDR
jgi:hypothetical protein